MKKANDLHLARRSFHALGGAILLVTGLILDNRANFGFLLAILLVVSLGLECLRLSSKQWREILNSRFSVLMRQGEESRINGVPYYLAGCFISVVLFPHPVEIYAIAFLAFGDPVASVFGGQFAGKKKNPLFHEFSNKSFVGSLACFGICFLFTLISFHYFFPDSSMALFWMTAVAAGLCGAIAELLPLRTDDNLSLPLVSGGLFWLYGAFVGLLPGLIY